MPQIWRKRKRQPPLLAIDVFFFSFLDLRSFEPMPLYGTIQKRLPVEILMCGKVSHNSFVELTDASAIPQSMGYLIRLEY